jgi:low affinity Fe/Cu permease
MNNKAQLEISDLLENPAFIILAGGGIAMEIIGWIVSKRMMDYSFPLWQLLIMIVVTVIASAIFANRD